MGLLPREGKFFDLFNQHAELAALAAVELTALFSDLSQLETRSRAIERNEKQADRITHETVQLLHKTFITPLDRDEIHRLINAMDDILDLLQDSSEVMSLYDVQRISEDVVRLGEISVRCCERVQHVVSLLPKLRHAEVAADALKTCEEIDRLESDADRVMRGAMSRLFREEMDTRELIKLKAIYEHLESISDRCEDVADLIEGIVLENS